MSKKRLLMVLGSKVLYPDYDLYDNFSDTLAAGSVNGTKATDKRNLRTVIDTGNKLSIDGNSLVFTATGINDPLISYPAIKRELGKSIYVIAGADSDKTSFIGLVQSIGGIRETGFYFQSAAVMLQGGITRSIEKNQFSKVSFDLVCLLRSAGSQYLTKHGYYWRFSGIDLSGSTENLYVQATPVSNGNIISDIITVSKTKYLISPIISDSFNRANGAIGDTDGAGHAELVGLGSGGNGLSWSNALGAYTIVANKAVSSTLDGGVAITICDAETENFYINVKQVITSGYCGVVYRYIDNNNYLYTYHDKTNLVTGQVIGGTNTVLQTTVKTYNASQYLSVVADGTLIRTFYDNSQVGSDIRIVDQTLQQATKVGLISSNEVNTSDDFTVYPRRITYPYEIEKIAKNSNYPLYIPTYDGGNQAVHPSVYYNASKWNGFEYWMAMTPYAGSVEAIENPSILVSHDGEAWYIPTGLTNPVVPAPAEGTHNSDPNLLVDAASTMWMYYNYGSVYVVSSTNGITWSAPVVVATYDTEAYLSPSVLYDGSQYVMWTVDIHQDPRVLQRRTCATPNGTFSAGTNCTVTNMPSGMTFWHVTVQNDGAGFLAYAVLRIGTATAGSQLWVARSSDGLEWTFDTTALLVKSSYGFDYNRIYTSCEANGKLFYSAMAAEGVWNIGVTTP